MVADLLIMAEEVTEVDPVDGLNPFLQDGAPVVREVDMEVGQVKYATFKLQNIK